MKKIMMLFAVVATTAFVRAATVDWQYTGTAAEKAYTVLVFSSEVASNYKTYDEFAAGAIGTATVNEVSGRGGSKSYTIASQKAPVSAGTESLYFAIIENSAADTFKWGVGNVSALVYDPDNQESSKGTFELTNASFVKAGTIGGTTPGGVPEPTSGLLLVLGMAGLALRRKHA